MSGNSIKKINDSLREICEMLDGAISSVPNGPPQTRPTAEQEKPSETGEVNISVTLREGNAAAIARIIQISLHATSPSEGNEWNIERKPLETLASQKDQAASPDYSDRILKISLPENKVSGLAGALESLASRIKQDKGKLSEVFSLLRKIETYSDGIADRTQQPAGTKIYLSYGENGLAMSILSNLPPMLEGYPLSAHLRHKGKNGEPLKWETTRKVKVTGGSEFYLKNLTFEEVRNLLGERLEALRKEYPIDGPEAKNKNGSLIRGLAGQERSGSRA